MKQQTAVEYLVDQLQDHALAPVSNNEESVIKIPVWIFKDKINIAKHMELEQQEVMFNCGRNYQLTAESTFKQIHDKLYGN